jgi:hypothetical protein
MDCRFGMHKVETTYIPSNQVQDFIDKEEQHNDTNCKFTVDNYKEMKDEIALSMLG